MVKPSARAYSLGSPLSELTPAPIVAQRDPTTNDTNYEIGQPWVNKASNRYYILTGVTSGAATWTIASPGASDVDTITGDTGGALSPAGGNITIAGGTGISTSGSGSTLTINASAGQASISEYVVDAAGGADYTTVQAALDAANSAGGGSVYVRPGSYTESLTLYDAVNIIGTGWNGVTITGIHTPPTSGNILFQNLTLTSATHIFNSGAAGTTSITVEDSVLTCTSGHVFNLPNWTGDLGFYTSSALGANCGFISNSGGSAVSMQAALVGNGTGTTASVSGAIDFQHTEIGCPLTLGTGTTGTLTAVQFNGAVTAAGDSAVTFAGCAFATAANPSLTMSSSGAVNLAGCVINSSNSPAIDGAGAGTLDICGVDFLDNAEVAATLTVSSGSSVTGTSRALTFDTDVAAAGVTLSGTTLAADGTDSNISITMTPKGTGSLSVTSGDAIVSSGNAGGDRTVEVTNTDNTDPASRAGFEAAVGGTSAGDPYVNFLISGGQAFTMGIDNSATNDDFVISDAAALGTNNRVSIDGSTGVVSIPTSDLTVTRAGGAATAVVASVVNTDNANTDSPAQVTIESGGTSGGDAFALFQINGGQAFSAGIDNSATNDDFVISDSAAPGTNNRLVIDGSTGDTSITGNLALPTAATQLQVEGGAVTDFIGQATLTAGTVTVANTNIAAGDRILCTRSSINGSTALGILITSISAGANFTITAVQPGTPGSTETNDTSIVDYFIVRSL